MKTNKIEEQKPEKEAPEKPKQPEILPNPKERPATEPEKPDRIPPDVRPGKNNPEVAPTKHE